MGDASLCHPLATTAVWDVLVSTLLHLSNMKKRAGKIPVPPPVVKLFCLYHLSVNLHLFFSGLLFYGRRGFASAISAARQARGPSVHYDAFLDPGRALWRFSEHPTLLNYASFGHVVTFRLSEPRWRMGKPTTYYIYFSVSVQCTLSQTRNSISVGALHCTYLACKVLCTL